MTANAKHSSKSQEHLTPEYIVAPSRVTLGQIDLDPATCPEANILVGASQIFTRREDGLSQRWHGNVLLNPPGGSLKKSMTIEDPGKFGYTKSRQALWWLKLMIEWAGGFVQNAIFIGFSIEILQTAQVLKGCPYPTDWTMCVPFERIPFDKWANGRRESQEEPSHANVIVLVSLDPQMIERFAESFKSIGEVFNYQHLLED